MELMRAVRRPSHQLLTDSISLTGAARVARLRIQFGAPDLHRCQHDLDELWTLHVGKNNYLESVTPSLRDRFGAQIFFRKRNITSPTTDPTRAHSATRFCQSKLKRTHALARGSSTPIAVKILGAVIEPEVQAEPCDACTPARSNAGNKLRPSTSSKHNMTVLGTLLSRGVKTSNGHERALRPSRKALRLLAITAARCGCSVIASSIASAFAAASEGLCVPGRRPNYWAPPRMKGCSWLSRRRQSSTP